MTINKKLSNKLSDLRADIREMGSLAVAYSGGVDSTFLMWVANDELADRALAVTAFSETYPRWEGEEADSMARAFGFRHRAVHTSELDIPNFRDNPPERCYYCKSELFGTLRRIADEEGLRHVADGSTTSDIGDHRPGRRAAAEKGVLSPLIRAKLDKKEIRLLSRELGIPTWDKPAFACLASRFPDHEEITEEKLDRVDKAELFLRSIGLTLCRVRSHGTIARIEIEPSQMETILFPKRELISRHLRSLGFTYVTLDLEGYRSGSMNAVLTEEQLEHWKTPGEGDPGDTRS